MNSYVSVNVCMQAQAFTTSYSDVGLFGVQAVASHFDIGKVSILFVFVSSLLIMLVWLLKKCDIQPSDLVSLVVDRSR